VNEFCELAEDALKQAHQHQLFVASSSNSSSSSTNNNNNNSCCSCNSSSCCSYCCNSCFCELAGVCVETGLSVVCNQK